MVRKTTFKLIVQQDTLDLHRKQEQTNFDKISSISPSPWFSRTRAIKSRPWFQYHRKAVTLSGKELVSVVRDRPRTTKYEILSLKSVKNLPYNSAHLNINWDEIREAVRLFHLKTIKNWLPVAGTSLLSSIKAWASSSYICARNKVVFKASNKT